MKISKRPVSLMEMLIAMVLTISILMTLTFFYQQVVMIGEDIDQIKSRDFYTRLVENRLAYILPRTLPVKDKNFAFFSIGDEGITQPGSQSLIFTFDNGVSLDKVFSNQVICRLLVDKQGRLILAFWPVPSNWEKNLPPPMKQQILLEGVESMEFAFFIAPAPPEKPKEKTAEPSKDPKKPLPEKDEANKEGEKENKDDSSSKTKQEPEPKGDWRQEPWLKEFNQLPVMVKIILKLDGVNDKVTFVYPLVNTNSHILYE